MHCYQDITLCFKIIFCMHLSALCVVCCVVSLGNSCRTIKSNEKSHFFTLTHCRSISNNTHVIQILNKSRLRLAEPQMKMLNWLYLALWLSVSKNNLVNWINYWCVNWEFRKALSKYRTLQSMSNASLHRVIIKWEMSKASTWHKAQKEIETVFKFSMSITRPRCVYTLVFHAKMVTALTF